MGFDPSDLYEIEQGVKRLEVWLERIANACQVVADICEWQKAEAIKHMQSHEHEIAVKVSEAALKDIEARIERDRARSMGPPVKE